MPEGPITDCWKYAFVYLMLGAMPHMVLGIAGSVIAALTNVVRRRPLLPAIAWPWVLTATLWLTGCLFNIIWSLFVYNRLYWSYDYTGWDCSPLGLSLYGGPGVPVTYHHGITEWSLRALWCLYAILAWSSAVWASRCIMRFARKIPAPGEQHWRRNSQ